MAPRRLFAGIAALSLLSLAPAAQGAEVKMHTTKSGKEAPADKLRAANSANQGRPIKITVRPDLVLEAAGRNELRYLKAALAAGANPNATDSDDTTPLMRAALAGHANAVRILLAAGAHISAINKRGETALDIAIKGRRTDVATVLIDSVPKDVLSGDASAKLAAEAASACAPDAIPLLAGAGVDFQRADQRGITPLMVAAEHCDQQTMRQLLPLASHTDATDARGRTALMHAARRGNSETVSFLILAGADPDKADAEAQTPLTVSIRNRGKAVVRILLGATKKIDAKTAKGNTALLIAADAGDTTTAAALIAQKASVDGSNARGTTPLIAASVRGHPKMAALLTGAGASQNAHDAAQLTALDWSRSAHHDEIMRILEGANVRQQ